MAATEGVRGAVEHLQSGPDPPCERALHRQTVLSRTVPSVWEELRVATGGENEATGAAGAGASFAAAAERGAGGGEGGKKKERRGKSGRCGAARARGPGETDRGGRRARDGKSKKKS